ncbi:MAG: hypothetical protein ACLSV2_02535 [Clostridium sp.]
MKIGFRKSSILRGYNRGMMWVLGIYFLSCMITYIAYMNGLIVIKDKVYLELARDTITTNLLYPNYVLLNMLEEAMPVILGIILFINYSKIFSYKAIKVNITPISNRQKMGKLFLFYCVYYLAYIIISAIFIILIWGIKEGNIINMIMHYISRIGASGVVILPLIIGDIKLKTNQLEEGVKIISRAGLVILTFVFLFIIMILGSNWGMNQHIFDNILFIITILEALYILKEIDKLKIA